MRGDLNHTGKIFNSTERNKGEGLSALTEIKRNLELLSII